MNEHKDRLQTPQNNNETSLATDINNDKATANDENVDQFYNKQILSAENNDKEIANNDGSVKETLDTAFHDTPGYISNHSIAGSNRADYYEKRSQGKNDTEEEQDYMRNQEP